MQVSLYSLVVFPRCSKKLIGAAGESLTHVTEVIAKIADKALDVFEELSNAVLASLKRVVPAITESLNKVR